MKGLVCLIALLCSIILPVQAGQSWSRPLQEVAGRAQLAFKAKVLGAEFRYIEDEGHRTDYRVAPTGLLKGKGPLPQEMQLFHFEPLPKDSEGRVLTGKSPLVDGSGEEGSVAAGEERIFLIAGDWRTDAGPVETLRVEPAAREAEIVRLLHAPR